MEKTIKRVLHPPKLKAKKKVVAYVRVSCGKDAMLHSLSAQISYYSSMIQSKGDWEYAGVYADEESREQRNSEKSSSGFWKIAAAGK